MTVSISAEVDHMHSGVESHYIERVLQKSNRGFDYPTGSYRAESVNFHVPHLTRVASGYLVNIARPFAMESLEDKLDKIRNGFGLNMSQLALVLNASRRALYIWYEGNTDPQKENLERIEVLSNLANEWIKLAPENRVARLKVKISNISLLDLISSDVIDAGEIKAFMSRLRSVPLNVDHYVVENAIAAKALRSKSASRNISYPAYGTDPMFPGKIVEFHEDGRKVPGKIVDGVFVANA